MIGLVGFLYTFKDGTTLCMMQQLHSMVFKLASEVAPVRELRFHFVQVNVKQKSLLPRKGATMNVNFLLNYESIGLII